MIEIGCFVLRSSVMSRRAKFHSTGIVTEFLTLIKGASVDLISAPLCFDFVYSTEIEVCGILLSWKRREF